MTVIVKFLSKQIFIFNSPIDLRISFFRNIFNSGLSIFYFNCQRHCLLSIVLHSFLSTKLTLLRIKNCCLCWTFNLSEERVLEDCVSWFVFFARMLVNLDLKNQFRLHRGPSEWRNLVRTDTFFIFSSFSETWAETSAFTITDSLSLRLRKLAYSLWRWSLWSELQTIHSTLSHTLDPTNPMQREEPITHLGHWCLDFGSYLLRCIVLFQRL